MVFIEMKKRRRQRSAPTSFARRARAREHGYIQHLRPPCASVPLADLPETVENSLRVPDTPRSIEPDCVTASAYCGPVCYFTPTINSGPSGP